MLPILAIPIMEFVIHAIPLVTHSPILLPDLMDSLPGYPKLATHSLQGPTGLKQA